MWAEITAIIGGSLFVTIAIIWNIVISKRESSIKNISENAARIKNYSHRAFTNGHFEGVVIKDEPRKNGCSFIEFQPTDYQTGEGKKRPGVQRYIAHESKIKRLAKGALSPVDQMITIPENPEEIPEELRKISLGNWMQKESSAAFLRRTFGNRTKNTLDAASTMIEESTHLKLTDQYLANLKELKKESEKISSVNIQREDNTEKKG